MPYSLSIDFTRFFLSSYPGAVLQALPIVLLTGAIYWLIKYRNDTAAPAAQKLLKTLFVAYLAGIACMVFFYSSIRYFWGFIFGENKASNIITVFFCKRTANFIPDFYRRLNRERILNVVLFLPFGFLYPLANRVDSWAKTVRTGLITIVLIEALQPVFARAFDVNDLILNAFGVLFSATVFFLLRRIVGRIREKRQAAAQNQDPESTPSE